MPKRLQSNARYTHLSHALPRLCSLSGTKHNALPSTLESPTSVREFGKNLHVDEGIVDLQVRSWVFLDLALAPAMMEENKSFHGLASPALLPSLKVTSHSSAKGGGGRAGLYIYIGWMANSVEKSLSSKVGTCPRFRVL